jgi:creatinine amidohydrolase
MAHACELETSVYLHLDAARVRKNEIRKDMKMPESEFIWMDLMEGSPVLLMDEWTRFSKSGVSGDPTLANPEKGKVVFEAVVDAFVRLVREFKNRPRGERTDYHRTGWNPQSAE